MLKILYINHNKEDDVAREVVLSSTLRPLHSVDLMPTTETFINPIGRHVF